MEDRLFTAEDLAGRWRCTVETIREKVRIGELMPCKNIPLKTLLFRFDYIQSLEGIKQSKMSPLERKRLEDRIKELETENEGLKSFINNIVSLVFNFQEIRRMWK